MTGAKQITPEPGLPPDYLNWIKKSTTWLEQLGDKFTTVDQRVDYVVKHLAKANVVLGDINAGIKDLLLKEKEKAMIGETTQVRFQKTVVALTGDKFTEECPFDAIITSICFHFPTNGGALVDVAVGHGGRQCFPREGYIALDGATPVFATSELVDKDELLWAEIRNGDDSNPHTITVIFTLEERL